jgi:hypothetical protein
VEFTHAAKQGLARFAVGFEAQRWVGTNHLANATMETFAQGTTPSAPSANCFSCHTTNKVPVSHVYPRLTPLP